MTGYYRLDCSDSRFVELSEGNDWEGVACPKHEGHQRAGRRITRLNINFVSKQAVDFASTILGDIVISNDALRVLEGAKLTGFRVKPVVVRASPQGTDLNAMPKLWEFLVTGDGGFSHPSSGIKLKHECDACGLVRYSAYEHGLVVNEDAYDGSDFFTIREYPTHVLVNKRAKDVIERGLLAGAKFIESSKLMWPEGVTKP